MNEILTAIEVIIASILGSALGVLLPVIAFVIIFLPIGYLLYKWDQKYQKTPRMRIEKHDAIICLLLFAIKPWISFVYLSYLIQQHRDKLKNLTPETSL